MTLNNFNPTVEQMARAKVLLSDDLKEILKRMEAGAVIRESTITGPYKVGPRLVDEINIINRGISIRLVRTLVNAGLILPTEFDDYIEYRLTYDPKITSIKDVE